jgi:hypothetical protein
VCFFPSAFIPVLDRANDPLHDVAGYPAAVDVAKTCHGGCHCFLSGILSGSRIEHGARVRKVPGCRKCRAPLVLRLHVQRS